MDLVIRPGVLASELVARKAEDEKVVGVLGFNGLPEGFETLELGREAAFGGSVDDEDDFALERREGVRGAFLCRGKCG